MEQGTVTTQPHGQSFIIKRPRLTKLLDESGARIILLVAPAGYGKTTLAREWLSGFREPAAWYPASAASADVAALATGLATELDRALAETGGRSTARLAALAAVHQRPDVLARVLVASRRSWPRRLVVAIDDYNKLANSSDAEEFIGTLVQLLPATFLITSRARPTWFAPRLTVYGEAFEVTKRQLAMTEAEVLAVLENSPGRKTGQAISRLACGWPAIIGLAARTDRDDLPEALPSRLYEFLANELVAAAPTNVQEALTVLALTGTRDAAVASKLLGSTADYALNEAETRGLLTRDDHDHIALHPLLAEHLIHQLRRREDRLATVVHPLATRLVESHRWDECLALAEAIPEEPIPVAEVLESALEDFLINGRIATLRRWIDLARQTSVAAPIVDLADGEVALRAGEFERALALGSRAARRIDSPELRCRAQLLAARAAHLAEQGSLAADWFREAEVGAPSSELEAAAVWGQFLVQYEDETGDLEHALQRFADLVDGSVNHELQLSQGRLLLGLAQRNIDAAIEAGRLAEGVLSLPGDPLIRLASLNQQAWVLGWGGKYRQALEAAERALREADATGIDFVVCHALVAKATALIGLRKFASAQQTITEITDRREEEPDGWTEANAAIASAKLCVSLGDLDRAAHHLTFDPGVRQCVSLRAEYDGYRGLIAAAQGFTDEATKWLERCARWSTHVEAHAIGAMGQAILSTSTGEDEVAAIEHFATAVGTGFRDVIIIGCRAQPGLARLVVQHGTYRDVLKTAFIESADTAIARAVGLLIPRIPTRGESLSPRELEVYELMVQGRTNRQIAQTLFVTESTTKVHVKHIFEKLGVRSRVEAVRAWQTTTTRHKTDAT